MAVLFENMIETERLLTKDLEGYVYMTKDKIFFNTLEDVNDKLISENFSFVTDYAVMNGAPLFKNKHGTKNSTLYFLRSAHFDDSVKVVNAFMNAYSLISNVHSNCKEIGVRPSLHLNISSYISAIRESRDFSKIELQNTKFMKDELYTLTLGELPKTYVGEKLNFILESDFNSHTIKPTGKTWNGYQNNDGTFVQNEEFEYNGSRYARVKTLNNFDGNSKYSDGTKAPENGTYKWCKIEPITWKIKNWNDLPKEINPNGSGKAGYIDVQTEDCVISGIPFSKDGKTSLWKDCSIRKYLNNEFLAQVFNIEIEKVEDETASVKDEIIENIETRRLTKLERMNPDKTPEYQRRKMTDTEIIKSWIDAGQSVLLRGPSGIGKTERIKTLYPDLIYIKLTNNMFPEKVVGSMNLQTGQSIPPDFAKHAILACATKEERELVNENIQNLYEILTLYMKEVKKVMIKL